MNAEDLRWLDSSARELMRQRRGWPQTKSLKSLADGPGKLTQALGIGLEMSGTRLGTAVQLLPPAVPIVPQNIVARPRIGIAQARYLPWRFYVTDVRSDFV